MAKASATVKSCMDLYLRAIDEAPLLTAVQERQLCRRIIAENCPRARNQMICSNLRLVVSLAKRYANRGLPLPDLIEEGNLGLMRAVEGFDPEQGARFSTYGSWWIKQAIKRALINAVQPIHIPAYMVELIVKWKKATKYLEELLGRTPTLQELATEMDLPIKKVSIIRKAVRAFQRPPQTDGGEDGMSLSEMLHDTKTCRPDEGALQKDDLATISKLLDAIDEREATILRLRYGLDGHEPLTLKEIGKHVGLTRERVRQIEIEALDKLNVRLNSARPFSSEHERPRRQSRRRKRKTDDDVRRPRRAKAANSN